MKKIIFSLVLSLAIVVAGGIVNTNSANAQSASFPVGCSSWLGYSVTDGATCNGTTNSPVDRPMPGCTTALGYSITNGDPCSGGTVALSHLGGCSSTYGYSTLDAAPCNGTLVAYTSTYTPGSVFLPTTGDGGNASKNVALLVSSGLIASIGLAYFVMRKPKVV